jgi:hypothetical protein
MPGFVRGYNYHSYMFPLQEEDFHLEEWEARGRSIYTAQKECLKKGTSPLLRGTEYALARKLCMEGLRVTG